MLVINSDDMKAIHTHKRACVEKKTNEF